MERSNGVLVHPTSFPGAYGIGEFNAYAYSFIDILAEAGQKLWQVLPLGPTGYGDSPYQCFSAFAGNPLLICLDQLVQEQALDPAALVSAPDFPVDRVDYGPVIEFKFRVLRDSLPYFLKHATPSALNDFWLFCERNAAWLDDYALFMALKDAHNGGVWNTWERQIARHEPWALAQWRQKLQAQVQTYQYLQFQFFKQWNALKQYANSKGVRVIGDIPIFVAYDSADAWAHRDLFYFDEDGNSTVIAGVPPDYFSPTGQRWGNPLYRWDVMAQQCFAWWIERCRAAFELYDIVRIDHFRGFEAYWEVPASEPTAMHGKWVKAPGHELFRAIEGALGKLPIIAEDLGVITPEVEALRDAFNFPGMRVLQFAFVADTKSTYLPHSYIPNCVAYSGTHDNNTTVGWFRSLDPAPLAQVLRYTGTDGSHIQWDMLRLLMMSVAGMTVVTMQDLMGLGEEARMNMPGRAGGNWGWRFTPDMLRADILAQLKQMTEAYGR
jgi:4-alpha-glucanotransferase